jgi:alpha-D-xyloside xylohydrolase
MRARLLLAVAALPLLIACPAQEEPPPTGLWADFDLEAGELSLGRDDVVLLLFDAGAIQLGTVPELDDGRSYDPFFLAESVTWASITSIEPMTADDGRLEATLTFDGGLTARLGLYGQADGRFEVQLVPTAESAGSLAFYRLAPQVDPNEGFYGLGGVLDTPNHRGKRRAMQIEADPDVESFNNEAHTPIPLLIGTAGWGLFVEDFHPMLFDVATSRDDRVEVTVGTGMDSGEGLIFHLYAAAHPLDITKHYYDTTGQFDLPADWALGPWIWRDENDDEAQVRSDLGIIRDLDLATTGYWIDRPYASGVNTFDFLPSGYPDPQGMIDLAHDLGFRMGLWHTPYLDPDHATALHDEAEAAGYFPPVTPGTYFAWSWPIDLTNPEAYAWWQDLVRIYADMGIEGWKLDYAEDVQFGINGNRYRWAFDDGSDERTMHHRYQELYHRVYSETMPDDGGFLLCRTATWGDQVNGVIVWPGDLDATMNEHGVPADDDGEAYTATGGLPASLVVGLSLGPSGFPFYGSDTGGYRHAPPDKEIFTRWFEQTALSSVMQVGTNSSDVPWEFDDDNGFDEEMLGWYREYARLHLRLWAYEWSYVQRLHDDGRAIMRPLGLAFPEHGSHPKYDYMFGDHLLVAPVVVYGDRTREVSLPTGRWVHWFTGEMFEGSGTFEIDAPLEQLPLLLAESGIVPMLRPTIDAIAPTTQPDLVDSYATDPGTLWPRIFPGPASSFVLFDGSRIEQEETGEAVTVRWTGGSDFVDGAIVELLGLGVAPTSVELDGEALAEAVDLDALEQGGGWLWSDAGRGSLFARIPPGSEQVVVGR